MKFSLVWFGRIIIFRSVAVYLGRIKFLAELTDMLISNSFGELAISNYAVGSI